jgi:hypothetical protein
MFENYLDHPNRELKTLTFSLNIRMILINYPKFSLRMICYT